METPASYYSITANVVRAQVKLINSFDKEKSLDLACYQDTVWLSAHCATGIHPCGHQVRLSTQDIKVNGSDA